LDHIKLYKYIYIFYTYTNVNEYYTLTLAQSVNKFHYEMYAYTECKSQTIHTHNTDANHIWWIRVWYVHWTASPLSYSGIKIKERLHKMTYSKHSDIASPNPNHNKLYKCRYNVVWVSQTRKQSRSSSFDNFQNIPPRNPKNELTSWKLSFFILKFKL
jgi:hypothetical protein